MINLGQKRKLAYAAALAAGNMAISLFFNSSARPRASRACGLVGNLFTNSSNTAATLELLTASQRRSSAAGTASSGRAAARRPS